MKAKPLIVGAFLLAPIMGAVAGQGMSTEPITSATELSAALPKTNAIATQNAATRTSARLPDHYAMETPEGRVEVHELALRGRYANRYDPYETWQPEVEENLTMLEARWDGGTLDARAERALRPHIPGDAPSAAQSRQSLREPPVHAAVDSARAGEMSHTGAMPQNRNASTAEPQIANMRVINVQEALASQN